MSFLRATVGPALALPQNRRIRARIRDPTGARLGYELPPGTGGVVTP